MMYEYIMLALARAPVVWQRLKLLSGRRWQWARPTSAERALGPVLVSRPRIYGLSGARRPASRRAVRPHQADSPDQTTCYRAVPPRSSDATRSASRMAWSRLADPSRRSSGSDHPRSRRAAIRLG